MSNSTGDHRRSTAPASSPVLRRWSALAGRLVRGTARTALGFAAPVAVALISPSLATASDATDTGDRFRRASRLHSHRAADCRTADHARFGTRHTHRRGVRRDHPRRSHRLTRRHQHSDHYRVVVRDGVRHRLHRCGCVQVFTAGHYDRVQKKVRTRGRYERVWVEPVYRTVSTRWGGCRRVLVRAGHYERVWRPGRVRYVTERVWVPGDWRFDRRC